MSRRAVRHPVQACQARTTLGTLLAHELATPVEDLVRHFVVQMLGDTQPLGVLFYGSGLRGGVGEDTLLDFYIIVERQADWPRSFLARQCNAILPPNVEYHEQSVNGQGMRAKVAILTLAQFRKLTGFATYDTTLWARFSQPSRLVWSRDTKAAGRIGACIMQAHVTAARWAALLGPEQGTPAAFWEGLYANTYAAELRVEKNGRSGSIVEAWPHRYEALLQPCWALAGIEVTKTGEELRPVLPDHEREAGKRAWAARVTLGRPLNILRLCKAAFTFAGGARYAAWKIRRHSGISIEVSPFAEKHPLLAAPPVLFRLWRRGLFRRC
ncbi:hypothetical protein [Acetobacter papayae]|uniref:hypothetical protein n=1 Tax=Acetobacter papayae TaxID=1076592 RepID=UPI0039E9353B